jgi:hypothetical protein
MYVLVEHFVTDPPAFWSDVRYALGSLPRFMTLHHCFPTPDGTRATCLWEAERLEDVRGYLESYLGPLARTLYYPVENAAGIALPSGVALPAPAEIPAPGPG